jgi:hypothetical protein
MELTTCPQCGFPAEVVWRATLESTDGPVEHAKVGCVEGHRFLLPAAALTPQHAAEPRSPDPTRP